MAKIRLVVGLILLLILFGLGTPVTADSDTVKWSEVNLPTEGESGSWVLASGSDVRHLTMAIDGSLYAYANPSGTNYTLFKSGDGGYSWSYTGRVKDIIVDIAVAPDDAGIVYYATASDVYRSTDAGNSFAKLPPNPGGAGSDNVTITSIDAGRQEGNNIIAVGTRDSDSSQYGGIYTLDEGKVIPSWVESNAGNYDVYAVALSPDFAGDRQMVAVVSDETDTLVTTRVGDGGWSETTGNAVIEGLVPASACVAFPDDYDATTEEHVLFVGIEAGSDNGDVYKVSSVAVLDSLVATDLNIGSLYELGDVDVTSLAISGDAASADILAGGSAEVYYSGDGGKSWRRSRKPPTGQSKTYLVMATDFSSSGRVYAATSGSESAFSVTEDGGVTWNQVSLIDTKIADIVDRIESPNYIRDNTLFMLTFDGEHSLWQSLDGGAMWERVFTSALPGVDSIKLVELSPRYGDSSQVVFLAGTSNGEPAIWQSMDNGQNFLCQITHDPTTDDTFSIDIWVVVNDNTLFVGSYGYDDNKGLVYYTNNSGRIYSTGAIVGKQSLNTIVLSPDYDQDETILVGNTKGWVYWSDDNGVSFTPLPPGAVLPSFTRSVTIAFDQEFSSNKAVYAATPTADIYDIYRGLYKGIYRFVIGESTKWVYTLATTAPTLVGPEQDLLVGFNQVTGRAAPVIFTWGQPSEEVTKYELWLAFDGTFEEVVRRVSVEETETPARVVVGPEADTPLEFMPGTTYFWKVRAFSDYPIECQWSETRQFTVGEARVTPSVTIEVPPTPDVTVKFSPSKVTIEILPAPAPVIPPAQEVPAHLLWMLIGAGSALVIALAVVTRLSYQTNAPRLQSPKAGASGVPLKPLFQWSTVPGADSYELLVATNPSLVNPIIIKAGACALTGIEWQCDVRLNYDTTYYWKVRAINSNAWSAVAVFTTKLLLSISSPPPGHRPSRPLPSG